MARDANTRRSWICRLGLGASLCSAGGTGWAAKGLVPWGLRFSTSIPGLTPPGWEGWRSPHQVSEGKSPLGSKFPGLVRCRAPSRHSPIPYGSLQSTWMAASLPG